MRVISFGKRHLLLAAGSCSFSDTFTFVDGQFCATPRKSCRCFAIHFYQALRFAVVLFASR